MSQVWAEEGTILSSSSWRSETILHDAITDVEALQCEPYREILHAVAPAMPYLDRTGLKIAIPQELEAFLDRSQSPQGLANRGI